MSTFSFVPAAAFGGVLADRLLANLGHAVLTRDLLGNAIGLGDGLAELGGNRVLKRRVFGRRLPGPGLGAGIAAQRADGADRGLHLLVAEHHRAEHHFLGQLLGLGFDHEHRLLGAGDHEVELRVLERLVAGVQQVLSVLVADARGADRR